MNPNETTYQEGLRIECQNCGEQAQYHRLTPAGNFYCLEVRRDSSSWYKLVRFANPVKDERRAAMNLPVRELKKGNFPSGLGKALQAALTSRIPLT